MSSYTLPAALEARRRLCTVVVDGLASLGLLVAQQLVQLRLGTVILRDDTPVSDQDAGYRTIDCGRPRAEAAIELLGPRRQQSFVMEAPEEAAVSGADLHIVTGQGRPPVQSLRRAVAESPAVLPVLAARAGWQVGPLLLSDSPVCVECLDDCGLFSQGPEPDADPALPTVCAAAAVAVQQSMVLIDGVQRCVMEQAALISESATGMTAPAASRPRSDCACLARAGAPAAASGGGWVGL